MNSPRPPLHHWFTFITTLGGVQSVLKRHLQRDPENGRSTSLSVFFDKNPLDPKFGRSLGLRGYHSIAKARSILRTLPPLEPTPIHIAHNLWGLTFWADLVPCHRRIGILHSDWPGMPQFLAANKGLLDGLLCVSQPLLQMASHDTPELEGPRLALIHYPISNPLPNTHPTQDRSSRRPLVVGISGRIQVQQKRLDRLPKLLAQIQQDGVPCRIECVGDGPELAKIQKACSIHSQVRFLGRLEGAAYWQAISSWDAILFLSDYEGLPIALLEAMSTGAVPVFPKIQCGADHYVNAINPDLLYEPGNITAAVDRIKKLTICPESQWLDLRVKSRDSVQLHREENYFKTFSQFIATIETMPRISASRFPPRQPHWSDYCPFGILSRFAPKAAWRSPLR